MIFDAWNLYIANKFYMLKIIRLIIILIIAFIVTAWIWYNYQITIPASNDKSVIIFEIESGQGVNQISHNLYDQGLIKNMFYFEIHVWLKDLERNFIASSHEISPAMSIKEVTAKLTRAGESEKIITIIEGWNNKEIAEYLEEQDLFSQQDFLSEVGSNLSSYYEAYDFLQDKPQSVDLEGYLFPDTYRVFRNTSVSEVVKKMLDNFEQKLSNEQRASIKEQGKSIFEIITLASIIEKEVRDPEEMKMVADIFYKRLEAGIALQSDATVNYITGKGTVQPTYEDTKIDNPYNTYKYRGLPPGPISNPGLNAIMAAIEPTANQYYYFLTTKEGEVIYSKTYDEHLQNKAKYLD